MFKSVTYGSPSKCPNRTCKAVFFKDCHLGWLPKSELEVYTVMKCKTCRDVFAIVQMIHMVHDYKKELPERQIEKNKIVLFTENDQTAFRQELYSDGNPLWNLYDGYVPGASSVEDYKEEDEFDDEEDED